MTLVSNHAAGDEGIEASARSEIEDAITGREQGVRDRVATADAEVGVIERFDVGILVAEGTSDRVGAPVFVALRELAVGRNGRRLGWDRNKVGLASC